MTPRHETATPAHLVAVPELVRSAFVVVALLTVVAVFYEGIARLLPDRHGLAVAAGLAGATLAATVLWLAPKLTPSLRRAAGWMEDLPPLRALIVIVIAGLALRLVSAAWMGPVVTSDGAVYLGLANRLLEGRGYVDPRGDLAYWPPGLPMILAAAAFVIGPGKPAATILAVNLLSYLAATAGAYFLGRWLYGRAAGLGAAALLALWPNLVLGASGAAKEMPALALLTASVALYVYARRIARGRPAVALGALGGSGACLGMASLVQPALMFLPTAFALAELLAPTTWRQAILRLGVVIAGMAMVIAPWTMRNVEQLGAAVPIATNGGDVLYRANNALAGPGYNKSAPLDLRQYPEVERSRLGARLALQWIAAEPHRFLALAWQRLLHFSGDNSTSAYDAFRRDEHGLNHRFIALKALSNAAWLAIWLLILVAVGNGALWSAQSPGPWLLVLAYLYLAAMDSIAESGARHHVPFAGLLAVLAAATLTARESTSRPTPALAVKPHAGLQFLDFAAVGAVGTAAHFATLIALVQALGWPPAAATTAGFLVGAVVNYGLNYRLTFQSQARHAVALPRFLAIAVAGMGLNLAIVWALVHWQGVHYLIGQVVATVTVLVFNFLANRALTFGAPRPA